MKKNRKVLTGIVSFAAGVMLAGGGFVLADHFWEGHTNIVVTMSNIDKLTAKIKKDKQDLAGLNNDLDSLKASSASKDSQLQEKDKQIQQAIDDGNQKVADKQKDVDAKQAEVDAKQKEIDDLTAKVEALKANSDDLSQAITDAQAVRDYSDKAVQENQ